MANETAPPPTIEFAISATCSPRIGRVVARLVGRRGGEYEFSLASPNRERDGAPSAGTVHVRVSVAGASPHRVPPRVPLPVTARPTAVATDAPPGAHGRMAELPEDGAADPLAEFAEEHLVGTVPPAPPPPTTAREGPVFFPSEARPPLTTGFALPASPPADRDPADRAWTKPTAASILRPARQAATALLAFAHRARRPLGGTLRAARAMLHSAPAAGAALLGSRVNAVMILAAIVLALGAALLFAASRRSAPPATAGAVATTGAAVAPAVLPRADDSPVPTSGSASDAAPSAGTDNARESIEAAVGGDVHDGAATGRADRAAREPAAARAAHAAAPRLPATGGGPRADAARTTSDVVPVEAETAGRAGAFVGRLDVVSDPPGALVSIDGVTRGRAPLAITKLRAGAHTVRVEMPGYQRWTKAVSVASGSRTVLSPMLRPVHGKANGAHGDAAVAAAGRRR